jgi:hypothetical protein
MKKITMVVIIFLLVLIACNKPNSKTNPQNTSQISGQFPVLQGEYLGQKPPDSTPELFAPEIISTGLYERDVAMTPDGTEFYYGLMLSNYATIMVTKLENGQWTEPQVA